MYRTIFRCMNLERPYQPQRAEWVQVAALAAGLGASLLGGASSASAAARAERLRKEQDAKNEALYNRRYNESYLDSAAGRNAIRQATDYAREMNRKAEGAAAVTGGTDAAVAQAKEAGNKMIGETMGNLASQDTARKENAENTFLQQQQNSTAQQMANEQQKGAAIAQVAGGASNALMQGASLLGRSGSVKAAGNAAYNEYNSTVKTNTDIIPPTSPEQYAMKYGMPTDEQMGYKRKDGLIG